MRTNNTFGVQFISRTNKAKNGLLPIYARISVDGRRVEISLKRFMPTIGTMQKDQPRAKAKKFVTSTLTWNKSEAD